MKIPKQETVKDIMRRAGVNPTPQASMLPLSCRASDTERATARRDLMRKCPYLFTRKSVKK